MRVQLTRLFAALTAIVTSLTGLGCSSGEHDRVVAASSASSSHVEVPGAALDEVPADLVLSGMHGFCVGHEFRRGQWTMSEHDDASFAEHKFLAGGVRHELTLTMGLVSDPGSTSENVELGPSGKKIRRGRLNDGVGPVEVSGFVVVSGVIQGNSKIIWISFNPSDQIAEQTAVELARAVYGCHVIRNPT
jgi:hypothetical protein